MRGVVTPGGNTEPPVAPDPLALLVVALELEALVVVPPAPVLVSVAVVRFSEVLLVAVLLEPPVPFVAPVVFEPLVDTVVAAVVLDTAPVVDDPDVVAVVPVALLLLLASVAWLEVSPLGFESDAEQATALRYRMVAPRRRVLEVNIGGASGLPLLAKAIAQGRGAPSQMLQAAR